MLDYWYTLEMAGDTHGLKPKLHHPGVDLNLRLVRLSLFAACFNALYIFWNKVTRRQINIWERTTSASVGGWFLIFLKSDMLGMSSVAGTCGPESARNSVLY